VRAFGPTGRLAVGTVGGQPRRAGAVTVVVALGVALVAGTVVGIESLRAYTDQTMAARVPADLAMFAGDEPLPEVHTLQAASGDLTAPVPGTVILAHGRNADHEHRLLTEPSPEPALVFGSSFGGLIGVHLTARPGRLSRGGG
jgi:hypothetical protein